MHRGTCHERIYERICHSVCALVLLSYLPPGKQYRKYIRFYAQLLMVLAALRPLFVLFGGKDTFYEKMAYAQCMEKLSEFSRDTQKIAYLNQDRYRTEYENVIAENIRRRWMILQEYGLGNGECHCGTGGG